MNLDQAKRLLDLAETHIERGWFTDGLAYAKLAEISISAQQLVLTERGVVAAERGVAFAERALEDG